MPSKRNLKKSNYIFNFPVNLLKTKMEWKDLVLNPKTEKQVNDIIIWMQHNKSLSKDLKMGKRIRTGYRVLFYGPPGTGKTLTASLIGRQFNKDVYRIDLSLVSSKYIGETEKNLERIFKSAESKGWILFFDETDSLFGKRTDIKDSHDKYANLEISYLLQHLEEFPGLTILSSNSNNDFDLRILKRLNAVIHFPLPNPSERYALWEACLPPKIKLEKDLDLKSIAYKYELNAPSIFNVICYASLHSINKKSTELMKSDIIEGIGLEMEKWGKKFPG